NARGYKLQIGLRQLRWTGGVGVYFGGRPGPDPNLFHFQLIHVPLAGANDSSFRLARSTGWVEPVPAGAQPRGGRQEFAATTLRPLERGEQLLELEFKPRGLVSVRWNGDLCRELVSDKASERAMKEDYQGEFGIFCLGSNVIVTSARIQ